jgi:hypothetical protein
MISDTVGFIPEKWRMHAPGMQPLEDPVSIGLHLKLDDIWHEGMKAAIETALKLYELGVAKELANRVLVPYQYITLIISGSSIGYSNFFSLRTDANAQYEIRMLAIEMKNQYENSIPKERSFHLPFLDKEEYSIEDIKISVARCARLSYTTVDGSPSSIEKDLSLYERLLNDRHLSPFEFQVFSRSEANRLLGNGTWRSLAFKNDKKCCEESLNDLSGNLGNKKIVQLRKLIEKDLKI